LQRGTALAALATVFALQVVAVTPVRAAEAPAFNCPQGTLGEKPFSSGLNSPPSTVPLRNSWGFTCYYANYYDSAAGYHTVSVYFSKADGSTDYYGNGPATVRDSTLIYSQDRQAAAIYDNRDGAAGAGYARDLLAQDEAKGWGLPCGASATAAAGPIDVSLSGRPEGSSGVPVAGLMAAGVLAAAAGAGIALHRRRPRLVRAAAPVSPDVLYSGAEAIGILADEGLIMEVGAGPDGRPVYRPTGDLTRFNNNPQSRIPRRGGGSLRAVAFNELDPSGAFSDITVAASQGPPAPVAPVAAPVVPAAPSPPPPPPAPSNDHPSVEQVGTAEFIESVLDDVLHPHGDPNPADTTFYVRSDTPPVAPPAPPSPPQPSSHPTPPPQDHP
jgi:hypothetical protein